MDESKQQLCDHPNWAYARPGSGTLVFVTVVDHWDGGTPVLKSLAMHNDMARRLGQEMIDSANFVGDPKDFNSNVSDQTEQKNSRMVIESTAKGADDFTCGERPKPGCLWHEFEVVGDMQYRCRRCKTEATFEMGVYILKHRNGDEA